MHDLKKIAKLFLKRINDKEKNKNKNKNENKDSVIFELGKIQKYNPYFNRFLNFKLLIEKEKEKEKKEKKEEKLQEGKKNNKNKKKNEILLSDVQKRALKSSAVFYLPSVKIPYKMPNDPQFIKLFNEKIAYQEKWFLRWSKKLTNQYNEIKQDHWKRKIIKRIGIQRRNIKNTFIEQFSKTRVEKLLNEIAVGIVDPREKEMKKKELAQLYTIGYNYKNKHAYLREKKQRRPVKYDNIHINRELMERFIFEDPNLLPINEREKYFYYLSLERLVKDRVNWLVDRLLAAKIISFRFKDEEKKKKEKKKKEKKEKKKNIRTIQQMEAFIELRKLKDFSRKFVDLIRKRRKKKYKKKLLLEIQKVCKQKKKRLEINRLSLLTKNEKDEIKKEFEQRYNLRREELQEAQKAQKEELVWG